MRNLLAVGLVLAILSSAAVAETPATSTQPSPLAGEWRGEFNIGVGIGGNRTLNTGCIEISVADDGKAKAVLVLLIKGEGNAGTKSSKTEITGDDVKLSFETAEGPANFEGKIEHGKQINGNFVLKGKNFSAGVAAVIKRKGS
jgi:hypothetical protein